MQKDERPLVLSLFPGIGLLDMAFEEERPRLIAWAAGLFDGEGCVSLAKSHQAHRPDDIYYRVDLIVSNTNRDLLAPLEALFGGRISAFKRTGNRKRDAYQWKSTGSAHSAEILRELRPWLIAKAAQANVALRACALIERNGYRRPPDKLVALAALKQEMHGLNRRGADAVSA